MVSNSNVVVMIFEDPSGVVGCLLGKVVPFVVSCPVVAVQRTESALLVDTGFGEKAIDGVGEGRWEVGAGFGVGYHGGG